LGRRRSVGWICSWNRRAILFLKRVGID
jgi:hypothetical protein